jgi:peroxiredoxin
VALKLLFGIVLAATLGFAAAAQDTAPNFRLINQDGGIFEMYRLDEATLVALVAFDGTDEALLKELGGKRVKRKPKQDDLQVVLVAADPTLSRASLASLHAEAKLTAPILLDTAGSVSRAYGLRHPGEVVLVDPAAGWSIVGRLPGVAGLNNGAEAARQALAASSVPALAETPTTTDLSYSRDIAPILQTRCVNCHQEGGIGPFAMSSHKKVTGWSEMMQETILTKRMPPWHADPAHQHFQNSLELTTDEETKLMAWLRAGAPKADDEPDPLAEQAPAPHTDWAIGTPDHIVRMPVAAELDATEVIDYKYYYLPSGLTEDKWLRGVEVRAGNPKVVHHALIFVMYPPEYAHLQPEADSGLSGFFASFLPGAEAKSFPAGTAQFLPAGSTFVFQMHYSPTGKPETDQSELGLFFADAPPAEVLHVTSLATTEFEIEPHRADQAVSVDHKLEQPARLWGVLPHMHFRGQHFRYTSQRPGEAPETLLNVPWYQFDWQPMYWYDTPKDFPAGTKIQIDGAFDNSKYNPTNPDPTQTVEFGKQSFEEMFIGYMAVSKPYKPEEFTPQPVPATALEPITEDTLVGSSWDIGEDRPLKFLKDGVLKIAWFKGTWKLEGNQLKVELGGEFTVEILGNNLFLEGDRMIRIE